MRIDCGMMSTINSTLENPIEDTMFIVEMALVSGEFLFMYESGATADRFIVRNQTGGVTFDSSCFSSSGSPGIWFKYTPGGPTTISVEVLPNCAGGSSVPEWAFTVYCQKLYCRSSP